MRSGSISGSTPRILITRPFIGARVKSKVDGTYNITVTRRVDQPDGSFAGVVVTSVSMKFFQQLFDQVQVEVGGCHRVAGR